jgi:hypothetical protein
MSHFTVMVIGEEIEKQLAPFHEFECTGCNDEYVQDVDVTAESIEYGTDKETGVFDLEEALGYHGLKDRVVSDEADVEKTGEEPAHKYGYAVVKDGQLIKAVNRTNPNRKWDWYLVGDRCTGMFKMLEGKSGIVGKQGLMTPAAESGYADSALKCEIDFEGMREDAANKATVLYDKVSAVIADHLHGFIGWDKMRELHTGDIDAARKAYHGQPAKKALSECEDRDLAWIDVEDFICTREEYRKRAWDGAISTFAVLKDGQWYERGEMGWWGAVSGEKDKGEWVRQFSELIDSLPSDTRLTVVDCHI